MEEKIDRLIGHASEEKCPECRANLLVNLESDKWCSFVECDWTNSEEIAIFIKSLKPNNRSLAEVIMGALNKNSHHPTQD